MLSLDAEMKEFLEKGDSAHFGEVEIPKEIMGVLQARGIEKLYKHQADGIKKVRRGENVVITAPTASGKSEIYVVPIIEAALQNERSIVVYPTKALSRDQLARFREFALLGVKSEVYDGDTSPSMREKIRKELPHVLITNMDMLHFILLNSHLFRKFLHSLKYVVIDEIHTYTGTFGSHSSNIIKRLRRVHSKYSKKQLQFICCSATVGNALEFSEQLVGLPFSLVDARYAPRSTVQHILLNPNQTVEGRESYTALALKAARQLMGGGRKLLIFGNSHSVVERIGIIAGETNLHGIKIYRAGLEREERKRLEQEFKSGAIDALATTSALELGMDMGAVDSVILAGFPGTVTRVRQRIGRAGRRGKEANAVFIARDNPLDQYYFENPNEYLKGEPESCYVNPQNEFILKPHLLSLMRDYPADMKEILAFPEGEQLFSQLREEELCKEFAGGWIPTKKALRQMRQMSIRSAGESIRIYDSEKEKFIGEREEAMAYSELFPGAIYLHGGEKFVSEKLDLGKKTAFVRRLGHETSEYTVALRNREADVTELLGERASLGGQLSYGKVHISDEVYGYMLKDYFHETISRRALLDEPLQYEFDSTAVWFDFPEEAVFGTEDFPSGLHAVEHVSIAMMPALTGADPAEIGGVSYPAGRMYIYDSTPHGAGLSKIIFEKFERVEHMALSRLRSCRCARGCPSCILDPQCGNNNRHLDKKAAIEILGKLQDNER
ncbi:DEAD/DEAH box helicase [Candidatus Micrarchaeota archaeon]|nr:DEAD/DEAH box helicase [Candidatus Micrarchaeota archaeon]